MWRNKTGEVVSENIINNYKDKHKLVAWAVSNCKTESRYSCHMDTLMIQILSAPHQERGLRGRDEEVHLSGRVWRLWQPPLQKRVSEVHRHAGPVQVLSGLRELSVQGLRHGETVSEHPGGCVPGAGCDGGS